MICDLSTKKMRLQMVNARVTCRLYGALCAPYPEGWAGQGVSRPTGRQWGESRLKRNSNKRKMWVRRSVIFRLEICTAFGVHIALSWDVTSCSFVHSCQQKSFGLKFSKSQTGSDVRYSCHHNSSRFTFPIFAHSCRFSVLHSLQSITQRIY